MTDQAENTTGLADFIFGTLASTEDRVEAIIGAGRGLGAPTLAWRDGALHISLSAGPDAPIEEALLHYTLDGNDPQPGVPGTIVRAFQDVPPRWDTLLWGYVRRFELTIPTGQLPPHAMFRYRAAGRTRDGSIVQAADGRRFSHLLGTYPAPGWLRGAVIYHIFVDRFATTGGAPFAEPANLAGFYGGTLRGVIERLGYLSELGVTVLWLSPIYPSPSHHGYDATDFRKIEPRLGTEADLRELVNAAHARGMRVLLDFVPNHVSNEHPFFKDATTNPESPYREHFTFRKWPDDYASFFDVKTLPQINNENSTARHYVIDSAVYWLSMFGVDGFRLDYAYGPSPDFWADYFKAVKAINPESFHIGEIVETPELLRGFAGRMDGALDFHFLQAVRKAFAYDTMTIAQFNDWLGRHQAYFKDANFALPTFLDNHDMNRYLWAARGDSRRLKLAALVQFTLPAVPIIYYGTESGLSQERDIRQGALGILEESRQPMNWSAIDADLLAFYKRLIALRGSLAEALAGMRITLIADAAHYAFGYAVEGKLVALTLINRSPEQVTLTLPTAPGKWRDRFSDREYADGTPLAVTLDAFTGTILTLL